MSDKWQVYRTRLVYLLVNGCDKQCSKCYKNIHAKCSANDININDYIKSILLDEKIPYSELVEDVVDIVGKNKKEVTC